MATSGATSPGENSAARASFSSAASNADAARPNAEATAVSNASRWAVDQAASGERTLAPSRDRHCVATLRARSSSVCACATSTHPQSYTTPPRSSPALESARATALSKAEKEAARDAAASSNIPRAAWHSATFPRASPRFQIASKHAAEARARLCSALCALCVATWWPTLRVAFSETVRSYADSAAAARFAASSATRSYVRSARSNTGSAWSCASLLAKTSPIAASAFAKDTRATAAVSSETAFGVGSLSSLWTRSFERASKSCLSRFAAAASAFCSLTCCSRMASTPSNTSTDSLYSATAARLPSASAASREGTSGPTRAATSVADAVADRDSASARIASCLLSGFAAQYACESFVASSNALRIARDTSVSASRVDAAATAPSRDNFLSAASRLASAAATTASAPTGRDPSLSRAFLPRALAAAEALAPRPPRRCGGT